MKISLNSQQSTVNAIFQRAIHASFWHHQAGKSVFPMPNDASCYPAGSRSASTTRRHFLQVGEAAQRSALETRRQSLQRGEPPQRAGFATHWLPNAQCPMPIFNLKNFFPS